VTQEEEEADDAWEGKEKSKLTAWWKSMSPKMPFWVPLKWQFAYTLSSGKGPTVTNNVNHKGSIGDRSKAQVNNKILSQLAVLLP
jgi:hypothetical protein